MRFGWHCANVPPLQTDAMLAMPGSCYTVVVANAEHRQQARQIRAARPDATILLRPFWGPCNVFTDDPLQVVDKCIELLGDLPETLAADVVIGNEPNVETPGFDNRDLNHWRIAGLFLSMANTRAKLKRPAWRLHLCAAGPDATLQMETGLRQWQDIDRDLFVAVDCHTYWQRGNHLSEREGMRHLKLYDLWKRPVYISECGPVDVRDQTAATEIREWARAQPDWFVAGAALFSWWWGTGHPEFNYADKPALLASLRETMEEDVEVDIPDVAKLLMPRADWRNLVVTQTCAQHIEAGELPAVDVACLKDAEVEYRSPAGVVDFVTYEANNRGYCCGIVLDGTILDTRDFECWGPKGGHYEKGAFKWDDGSHDAHLEISPCHLAGGPLFVVGDRLEWGDLIQFMGWTGLVDPPGPMGKHLHLKLYLVKAGTAPTWAPYCFINPETIRVRLDA